jgi:tetratricopeptide (TPR) repeat protein
LANRSYAIASNDRLRGNLNEAEANFKLALQRDGNFFWAKWGLATLYYRKNEWDLAHRMLEELEISAGGEPRKLGAIFQTRGSIEEARGNIQEAIVLEKKAIAFYELAENTQGVANVKHNVGMALFDSGDVQGGLSFLLESLKLDLERGEKTGIAISSYNVGRVYAALKQTDKAKELFNQARENAITSKMALLATYSRASLAKLDLETGVSSERLVFEFQNIIQEFTNQGHLNGALEAQGELITLLQMRGQLAEAEDAVTSHIAQIDANKYPQVMNKTRYIAAEIYFEQGRFEDALDQLSLLTGEWKPVDAKRSLLKAKILHSLGDNQQALQLATNLRLTLAENWSEDHQAILEMIESKLALSVGLNPGPK